MKIVEERDGWKMTHEFEEMTPEKRPQDPCGDGTGLVFETLEHAMPLASDGLEFADDGVRRCHSAT